ncbi:MAG: hypothetical protein IM526_02970 [Microcystis sp. M38BS1]|uniref:hypothetical protein n=1 Tax=Microcystis sp. M38BS1 TaxID=2771188 RepID=UPI0031FBF3D4|nr:hypothetical protein [Microcystis sp. M38BS1]MCA6582625.1 hypothetical protein [Pseudanabaena sp. M34BS1SP1A06MG]
MTEQQFDNLMELMAEAHSKRLDAILKEKGTYTTEGYDLGANDYANECESYVTLVKILEATFGFECKE